MRHGLRSGVLSLMLLASLPLAVGCGPEVAGDAEALAGGSAALGAAAEAHADAGSDKVAVCHIPPGNPANAHTIVVGAPAVQAHLRHGDTLGACAAPDAGDGEGTPDGGEGTPDGGSCLPSGASCAEGGAACCFGLACGETGLCEPQIQ